MIALTLILYSKNIIEALMIYFPLLSSQMYVDYPNDQMCIGVPQQQWEIVRIQYMAQLTGKIEALVAPYWATILALMW